VKERSGWRGAWVLIQIFFVARTHEGRTSQRGGQVVSKRRAGRLKEAGRCGLKEAVSLQRHILSKGQYQSQYPCNPLSSTRASTLVTLVTLVTLATLYQGGIQAL
jgi:hypothetical protein